MDKHKVEWQAKEYVVAEKNVGWYVGLVIIAAGLVGLSIWRQWWTSVILIVVIVIVLFVYSLRPPRMLKYALDEEELKEGKQRYKLSDFRAFGVINENGNYAIILDPKKRFGGRVRVYFPAAQGEAIVDAFGAKLPMEEVKLDILDRIVKYLRI